MFMIGNDAIALGALGAGTRFMARYPITPASEIMEYLIKNCRNSVERSSKRKMRLQRQQQWLLALILAVRSFTASAGPGLSLMMEAIGLLSV